MADSLAVQLISHMSRTYQNYDPHTIWECYAPNSCAPSHSCNPSRKVVRKANQNIVFALAVKITVLLLGALGLAAMWMAVFADVGVTLIAVLNSLTLLKDR